MKNFHSIDEWSKSGWCEWHLSEIITCSSGKIAPSKVFHNKINCNYVEKKQQHGNYLSHAAAHDVIVPNDVTLCFNLFLHWLTTWLLQSVGSVLYYNHSTGFQFSLIKQYKVSVAFYAPTPSDIIVKLWTLRAKRFVKLKVSTEVIDRKCSFFFLQREIDVRPSCNPKNTAYAKQQVWYRWISVTKTVFEAVTAIKWKYLVRMENECGEDGETRFEDNYRFLATW